MLAWINQYVLGAAVPILLMAAGVFYALRLRCFPLFRLGAMGRARTDRSATGGVSPIRALSLALAGTLGVGNIVGVSAAIALGGFGSIFWMWVSALCAMLLKYAEIVLAMRYRHYDGEGKPHGSAMYYLRACFARMGMARLGGAIAAVFAVLCLLNAVSMGSVIQVNAVAGALEGVFGIPPLWTGTVLAVGIFFVIRRGSGGILGLTDRLVPLMTLGYLILSVAVLILRADRVPDAFGAILRDAFSVEATAGGVGGFFLSRRVRYGTMRGLISNEAGCGTAPAAHAVSACGVPAKQGVWGIVEVFVDTILLCTATALVILVAGEDAMLWGDNAVMMTIRAYSSVLGAWSEWFFCLALLCFGYATVLCCAGYGIESILFLSKKKRWRILYAGALAACILIGVFSAPDSIWGIADFAITALTTVNLYMLFAMRREIRRETFLQYREKG